MVKTDLPTSPPLQIQPRTWMAIAAVLLTWNGTAAFFANPFVMIQPYDGTQYHLLVRNRLHGHYELGDTAHTVREEGRHPIWRPGLVWIEEGLARLFGSVRWSAAVASALGAALLELALLLLTLRCFGRAACALVLLALLMPLRSGELYLLLAVGQGPEAWAAALLTLGLWLLVEGLRYPSVLRRVAAGFLGGAAECFRTGNYLIFLVPCIVVGLAALARKDRRSFAICVKVAWFYLGTVGLTTMLTPSPVNKTAVNLWHRLVEHDGEF